MLWELRVPGDYASIHLQIVSTKQLLSVPSSALIFDARELSVATVDGDNRVRLKPVSIARDLGATIELALGLSPNDRIIENPPDGITSGAVVRIASPSTGTPVDVMARSAVAGRMIRSWRRTRRDK